MKKKLLLFFLCITVLMQMSGCSKQSEFNNHVKGATEYTKKNNENVYRDLNFSDKSEFIFADQGLIDSPENLEIKDSNGNVVWSQDKYNFVTDSTPAPETVNPSLWSNTQMNHYYGLFELGKGIYQVRGYDITNLTLIKGNTGFIIIDPMSNIECSKEAMQLVYKNFGVLPIKGVILTSPNLSTYGGIKGILSELDVINNNIPVIAPVGFTEYAASQNIFVKDALNKIKDCEYGNLIECNETGSLSIGLALTEGKGHVSFIEPNDVINSTGEERIIDGIKFDFQKTYDTASPVNMNVFLPEKKSLYLSENCASTFGNLYDISSGKINDAKLWSDFLIQAISLYKDNIEVVFQAHNWPHFGKNESYNYILNTACAYKFLNDQTLNMINQGLSKDQIIHDFKFPDNIYVSWYLRQYSVSIASSISAVYEKYMSNHNENPIYLNKLSESQRAKKFVEYMGDINEILKMASSDFDMGEYQWVAEITNVIINADPSNEQARYLCADALEQLAYQSESGVDRNLYLSKSKELRDGKKQELIVSKVTNDEANLKLSTQNILDLISIHINSSKAENMDFKVNMELTDTKENYLLHIKNGVLIYYNGVKDENIKNKLVLSKEGLLSILNKILNEQKNNIVIQGEDSLKVLDDVIMKF